MNKVKLVWIDLRSRRGGSGLFGNMPECYDTRGVQNAQAIHTAIAESLPEFLCFEYDHPAVEQRNALQSTRLSWPRLPVLMFTEEHSEELAVWALRMRVWDYVVKPVSREDLCLRLAVLVQAVKLRQDAGHPAYLSPAEPHTADAGLAEKAPFGTAISFVEENLAEKISLHEVAQLCGLGPFQFSRAFKQEQGTTFREFLIKRRINRAIQLFDNPKSSVTDVAFAAGFNDLSYFARMFRRFTGVTPSHYRHERGLRETMRLPMPELPHNGPAEWPIAKYSYPSARKS